MLIFSNFMKIDIGGMRREVKDFVDFFFQNKESTIAYPN